MGKIALFHLRGGIDYGKLGFVHRSMMAMLKRSLGSKSEQDLTDEDRQILATYGKIVDFTDRASVRPIIEWAEKGEDKMKKVKITVLKTTFDAELAAQYGTEGLTACPMMKEGQVFYADYAKPEGLCDEAWKAIYQYVFALAHGAGKDVFYFGDWIKEPGVAICSCNDGLRPVIFKLEATEQGSALDYTPVR